MIPPHSGSPVDPERWRRVEHLFDAARGLPSAERLRFLAEACDGDTQLEQEVKALLDAHDGVGDFLAALDEERVAALIGVTGPTVGRGVEGEPALQVTARLKDALSERYVVESEIGRGGMATVYLAEDLKHHRRVAVKVLAPHLAALLGPNRFLQEIEIAAHLTHPHILPLFDSGQTSDGLLYYVMPYVEGESLRDRLVRERQLSVAEAVEIARQVANALDYAHGRGVVHRDIKPENILFVAGHAVIADFGIARAITNATEQRLTEPGLSPGTPAYMSPEQANGEPTIDGRSDIYSLAAVLYEMLGGASPFDAPSLQGIIARRLTEPPPSVREVRDTVPPHVDRAITRALARVPADRFATGAQFAEALSGSGVATEPEWASTARHRTVIGRRLGLLLVGAVVLGGAAVLLLGPWSPWRGGTPEPGAIRSVAVLPFEDLTADSTQEYFVDGMHEALIAELARVSDLRVISRTSAVRYRGTTLSAPEIARELSVDAVVEGSVLKSGDSVRIQASLIEAATDSAAGTVAYVRDLRNVLSLLNDVARGIASELAVAMRSEQAVGAQRRPVDPAAYEAYLRARHLMHDFRSDSFDEAVRLYERALALDSSFAQARTGLAFAYYLAGQFGSARRDDIWPLARLTATRAIELDENAAAAYSVLGYLALFADWSWDDAETLFLRALRLDPNDAFARHGYADLLAVQGRTEESLRQVELTREIDPLSQTVNGTVLGHAYFARQYEMVITEARRMRVAFDRPRFGSKFPAYALWQLGRYGEALQELRLSWSADEELVLVTDDGFAQEGPKGAMRAAADYQASHWGADAAYAIAETYAHAGAVDASLDWLEQAYRNRDPELPLAASDPTFDSLHSDPRFQDLMARLELASGGGT